MTSSTSQSSRSSIGYAPETSIFIVGASVFGLSSAYHLALAGYSNITVFDRAENLPTPHAASNDLNKIIRAEYGVGHAVDDFYTDLALEAVEAWSSPAWASCYRKTGYVRLARQKQSQKAIRMDVEYFSKPRSQARGTPRWFPSDSFHLLTTPKDIQQLIPQMTGANIGEEYQGVLNKHAGYALASKAIKLLHQRCSDLGVKFSLGADGDILRLLREPSNPQTVIGIEASNGRQHFHPGGERGLVILAMGAHLPRVLPEARTQLTAKAWSVAHLELSSSEADLLRDSPVISLNDLGFWIEPVLVKQDEKEDRPYLLKFAAHGGGWTRTLEDASNNHNQGGIAPRSLPPHEPIHAIPASDEELLRGLVRLTLPTSLHNRQFVKKSMCWCADTASSDFLIDFAPGYQGLLVAGADSGHAFKFLPIFGQWVVDVVKSGEQPENRWRWKTAGNCSNVGDNVAWRRGNIRDLNEVAMNQQ